MTRKELLNAILASNFDPEVIKHTVAESSRDINEQDSKGTTLLMFLAAKAPNSLAVEALLSMGADSRLKDKNGLTALDYAKRFHNQETENLLSTLRNFIS